MRLTLNPFSRGGKARSKAGKTAKARRPRMSRGRRRLIGGGLVAAGLAGLVGGGWYLATSGWTERAWRDAQASLLHGSAAAGLTVGEVVVEGRTHTKRADLLAALGVERGMPILAVDPAAARARVEALGWVRQATVARRLPDTVYLRIEERAPLALWQRNGTLQLVDREGAVIEKENVARFAGLPLIVGDDAPQHAADLLGLLTAFPEIASQLDAAVRVSGRRWNLRLSSGIDIRLPETGVAPALGRLADLHRTQKLLDRDVIAVDLRKPDRLIVRVNPEARDRIGRDGKNT
jgi:cell division protein FtsQ